MPNSTINVQSLVDRSRSFNELISTLSVAGSASEPALTCATKTMRALMAGYRFPDGRKVGPFPHKWNRIVCPPFVTNSYQQDYACVDLKAQLTPTLTTTLQWLEKGSWMDINNTSGRKPLGWIEAVRELDYASALLGGVFVLGKWQACWLPNDQLQYGVWGGSNGVGAGSQNPQAGSVYTNPVPGPSVLNPITQIIDANGNILSCMPWLSLPATTTGTTGSTAPVLAANSAAGATVVDGGVTWTVCNPKSPAFRLSPCPPAQSVPYQITLWGQMKPVAFTSMQQTLEPVPDDMFSYFYDGFVAFLYQSSPEANVRAKGPAMLAEWFRSLEDIASIGDREREAYGFVIESNIASGGCGIGTSEIGPAYPYLGGSVGNI